MVRRYCFRLDALGEMAPFSAGSRTIATVFSSETMPRRILLPLIVACALFMETLDATVLATALPTIAKAFGQDPIELKLALTSYMLAMAAGIPVSGWLADRFGGRSVFMAALAVFTLASFLCGLSTSLGELVAARTLQGIGGAMMVPVGRLVVLRGVEKSELLHAMAWLTLPALIGPMFGPALGGLIATYFDWRWVFWINIPIGLAGIAMTARFMPRLDIETRRPADRVGMLLLPAGILALMTGITNLNAALLPPTLTAALVALGAALLVAYALHSRRTTKALVDLAILRIRTFSLTILGVSMFRLGVGALPFLLPLLLQIGMGYTPFEAGLIMISFFVGALLMKLLAAPILQRLGYRTVLVANALLAGISIALPSVFGLATPVPLVLLVLLMGGFFRSLQFTAVNTLLYSDIAADRMSSATSLAAVAQQLGFAVSISLAATVLDWSSHGLELHTPGAFVVPFLTVGALAAASSISFALLKSGAGSDVVPKRRRQ